MGCSSSKEDLLRIHNEKFFVGHALFVNLQAGELGSQYEEKEVLGRGAQGEVKLVIHKASQEHRAMKKITRDQKNNYSQISMECQLLMYMDHPNIVKIYELFQDAKHFYIIYEYLNGGELYALIAKQKQLSEKIVSNYIKQILSALNQCHDYGVIHKDIKPQNILLDSQDQDAQLKLIDFGLATKKVEGDDAVAVQNATPMYASPEVLNDLQAYEQSDIWSCGIMTLQLLTGKLPYNNAQDATEICRKIMNRELDFSIFRTNRNLSIECKDFLEKTLTFDYDQRYNVKQALDHPWIQKAQNEHPLDQNIVKNLEQFHVKNKLQQAILQLLSSMMSRDDKQKLTKQFEAMDTNKDGQLSSTELKNGYLKIYHDEVKAQTLVDKIFLNRNLDKATGTLKYTEFLVAASEYNQLIQREKLENAFKIFDLDGNGQITIKELQQVMAGASKQKNEEWKELIKDFDQNNDGQISHQEFINTFLNKLHQE